jgi:thiol:disulfide interchange protein DsbD
LARKEGKRVLIDFTAEWCGWCKKMDHDVYAQPSVRALGGRYVFVRVDADRRPDVTRKYKVSGFPTAVVLDPGGREINRIIGYVDAQRFVVELER